MADRSIATEFVKRIYEKGDCCFSLSLKIINSYTQTLTLKFFRRSFLVLFVPSASDVY